MLTTAGLMRSTTSANLTRVAGTLPAALRTDVAVGPPLAVPRAAMDDWRVPPATIAPTRNATTAVSATVTKVNRRDIIPSPGPRRASVRAPPGRNGRALHSL